MLLFDVNTVVLVVGSIVALSGLIVARRPDAKSVIDQLTPYQALIGIALVVLAIVNFVRLLPHLEDMFHTVNLLFNAAMLIVLACSFLLGALFGMPQIAKLVPDQQAGQKAVELGQRLAPYQVMLGLVGLASSLVYFLYRFHIITYSA